MIRFLIRAAISLGTSAVALLVCFWVLPDFGLSLGGFLTAVIVFAIAQAVLSPFIFNVARKHASAILGGIGLVSTFVALLIASLFPGGLHISGVATWILSTLIVWIITALGTWLLPLIFLKKTVTKRG
ncbi:phage holin family protein [Microbacterium arabinogalactanolyticum]|uniref:phage holin family protein n=1 Tax=Microbacterium arabinogalactanolyticum TaxID=69365 RepID=UPI0025575119|nr:phage holin family protein [Microbacterium arabinogalactanolyticum]GLC85429.1 membrane protein [Microbacterium arabinogalactanolyticum]